MAGGATSARCPEAAAKAASVYTGLPSPIASIQLRIIGRFTGSRPGRGRLGPAAATCWASSRIAPAWAVAVASVAVICVPCLPLSRSALVPAQPGPGQRGTRGSPSPAVAMSSRWISLTPPPNVSTVLRFAWMSSHRLSSAVSGSAGSP